MKKSVLMIVLLVLTLSLSSCGNETKTKEPLVKYEDFRYNNVIGWDSSWQDVIDQYGEPDKVNLNHYYYAMIYYYVPVCGHDMTLTFRFSYDSNLLSSIYVTYKDNYFDNELKVKVFEDLSNGIMTKYGEPDYYGAHGKEDWKKSDIFCFKWLTQVEDTEIENWAYGSSYYWWEDDQYREHSLSYISKRDIKQRTPKGNRPDFALNRPSPTPDTTPTPTPVPTPNNQGI